jgi:hypothetical protein
MMRGDKCRPYIRLFLPLIIMDRRVKPGDDTLK